ncbi:nickel pincer cofactor biosynthesis protein LarC [Peribacillus simplex]|uniref:nickel pincer cofactor biosynthesis protein LarC n=1 Tax=Peribacillus TaxID=2675229 RepID=UPI00137995BA|nr:nickel pincer cofactor biosynthesis protein LarC [Peribacillus simplex]MBD8589350.1 nickel pincer cofactor biosynthesis protein LarC [Peribacillus simplex]NCT39772.1 nickel pincer cofactor biosynthesis protein LarC [Peribacillus frigoritolerans]
MKILYLDCQSGISGDMTLSALIDLGADIAYIREQLEQLPIDAFSLNVKQVDKKGISAKLLDLHFEEEAHVHDAHSHDQGHHHHDEEHSHSYSDHDHHDEGHGHSHSDHHHGGEGHSYNHHHHNEGHSHSHDHNNSHRKASTILNMINESELPSRVKKRSSAVFQVIAEAEGKIHGMDPNDVHFHEVGAMDSIIDVIGVCLALENLEIDKVIASPVPTGHGKVMMAHGLYPIPAPATAEILRGVPLADFHVTGELTTPTGAGFLKALADEYGHLPALPIERIGYGAGKKNFNHPNVLRALIFHENDGHQRETITILECQLDDITGETLGYVMEKILKHGALDVYFTPVTMKKSRPGSLITVLTKPQYSEAMEELLLKETSTFGVRKSECSRRILSRRFEKVETPYGNLTVKIGYEGEKIYKITPEYEEIKVAATEYNVPFQEIYSVVQLEARKMLEPVAN